LSVWEAFARIAGVAVEVFLAVLAGVAAGWVVDHVVPAVSPFGVLMGSVGGIAFAIYLMVAGMRAYVRAEGDPPAKKKEE
jgi:F0F1-type ATP synthase assembly protein I